MRQWGTGSTGCSPNNSDMRKRGRQTATRELTNRPVLATNYVIQASVPHKGPPCIYALIRKPEKALRKSLSNQIKTCENPYYSKIISAPFRCPMPVVHFRGL